MLGRDRLFSLPTNISHPLDLTLGTVVHLRGFDLATPAAVLQPGDEVDLTLYWQADGPTEVGYTVFAQLIGPDGQAHGQIDRLPAAGAAPTTSWAPGQVIIDALVVSLSESAPEGEYVIVVGLYDVGSGDRLLVVDEAWWMMKSEDTASFLYSIAKRGRKYYLGLATITQDAADFMKSPYGVPIVTNSSIQILLKQVTYLLYEFHN